MDINSRILSGNTRIRIDYCITSLSIYYVDQSQMTRCETPLSWYRTIIRPSKGERYNGIDANNISNAIFKVSASAKEKDAEREKKTIRQGHWMDRRFIHRYSNIRTEPRYLEGAGHLFNFAWILQLHKHIDLMMIVIFFQNENAHEKSTIIKGQSWWNRYVR